MKRILVAVFIVVVFAMAFFLLAENPTAIILPENVNTADLIVSDESEETPLEIFLSEEAHFFRDGTTIEIFSTNPDAEIYYTLNGSFPTTDSELYTEPIGLPGRGINVIVLRAIAVYGEEITAPYTHTFFFGSGIYERFDVMVFSVSTDDEYLYNYDDGIFIPGRLRDEFIQNNPGVPINPPAPANFNVRGRESERPVSVEVFLPNGERVFSQDAGMRVMGAWSRAELIKTVRLISRREYSPDSGWFNFEFFPDNITQDPYGFPVSSYNAIVLRNGGNDRNHSILRHELCTMLARNAGFLYAAPVRPAAIFVNGRYHGYTWLQTRIDEHYLQQLFNTPTRDFDVIGKGERWYNNVTDEQEEAIRYLDDFADRDLLDDDVFAELEAILDIDNMFWYYAFEIWLGNGDWPYNNLKRWRYTGEPFHDASPELDGRWRYILFDLDQTFGLFNSNWQRPTFQLVLENDNDNGRLLRNILTRPDMAERFTMIFCDIMENVCNIENVTAVFELLNNGIRREVGYTLDAYLLDFWVSAHSIQNNQDSIFPFAERRNEYIHTRLSSYFGFDADEMFEINMTGGEAVIGSSRGTSSRYFAHLTIPVSPVLPARTAFSHWLVNGARVDDETVYITVNNAVNGVAEIELVTIPDIPPLLIESAFTSANQNGIILINRTENTARTEGLYLSNSRDNLQRFRLPAATLAPGATLELAGRRSFGPGDLYRVKLNFNIRENRRVFLSNENGVILDTIILN